MEDKENFLSKITAARSFIYKVGSVPFTYLWGIVQLLLSVTINIWLGVASVESVCFSSGFCFRLLCASGLRDAVFSPKEKLKAFEERLVEERKKRLEDRRKQRKEERRNTYYRQKEEEAQRIREEQLKKGNLHVCGGTRTRQITI